MARQSTVLPSGSGAGKSKKFCTRGEEFFDLLKSMGYQPSRHQQSEHFEYLFQDEKSEKLVRKIILALKTENCLLPEDIERYNDLKKQNAVLHGSDLEEALARRRALTEMYSQHKEKRLAKKRVFELELESQTADVKRFSLYRDDVFTKESAELPIRQAKAAAILDMLCRQINEYQRHIGIDVKLLIEKTEDLEATVVQLKKNLNPTKSNEGSRYLCQFDVASLMGKEERLFEKLQQIITEHGTDLIIKDAGYAVQGDPLNEENMRKIFVQYEKDFDRLKHCIIYEKARQISLELSLSGQLGCLENLEEIRKKALQISMLDLDTKAKIQMQNRDNVNDLMIAYDKDDAILGSLVRELMSDAVNQQFSAITDIKARAKRKLQEFFSLSTTFLKAQKIRSSIMRNLVKSEGRIYGRLIKTIEQNMAASAVHSKKFEGKSFATRLSSEGLVLNHIFLLFGISNPLDFILSVPKTHLMACKLMEDLESSNENFIERSRVQSNNKKKQLDKTVHVLKDILMTSSEPKKGTLLSIMSKNEENLKQLKQELGKMEVARAGSWKEITKRRETANQKLKDLLSI